MKIYNTMSRGLEYFVPLDGRRVRMYTCGPTVYNYAHIGNYRAYMFEDLLRRHLEFSGFTVMQVMKADLATGQTASLTGPEPLIAGFAVAPAADVIALVMPLAGQERKRNPAYKIYVRPVGGAGPGVAIPTGETEQMVTPTFLP